MRKIEIFDTTCRDGEQATRFKDGMKSKIIIARELRDLGVSTIEAGFPKSSDEDFRAVQQIAREIHGPYICALARCVKEDIDSAWEAIKENEKPTLHVFTFMVDPKSMAAYGLDEFDKIVEQSARFVKYAKTIMGGKGRVEFSAQNATLGEPESIYKIYSAAIKAGADVVNIPDTAGYSLPNEVFDFVSKFIENVEGAKNVIVSTHCHNDLGNATANSIAAVQAGATQVECTINGLGERAGNAALEEVVMNLITRREKLDVEISINTALFGKISRLVSEHANTLVQPNKAVVGSNAFNHSSGIHQDGVKKGAMYEIMDPASVGWEGESFEITARSGKAGYQHRLERLGYTPEEITHKITEIVAKGKQLSDKKGILDDGDLRLLADEFITKL